MQTEWQAPESQDDLEDLEKAEKKLALGIPDWQIWSELGYEESQVDRFRKSNAKLAQEQLNMARRNFDQGGFSE